MSRKPVVLATAAVLAIGLAAPAQAGLFGKKKAETPPAAAAAPAAPAPKKASPELRIQAERTEPLARAAFWTAEATLDPADVEAGVKLSTALRAIGRYDEAVAAAERLAVLRPNEPEVLLEIGRSQIARGQGFYAVAPLRTAAGLSPKDWRPWSLLGVAFDQTSRPAEAQAAWVEALKRSPENPSVLSNLGLSLAAAGRAEEALVHLHKAAARPDATTQARLNYALVLGLEGRTAEAERVLREQLPPDQAEANLAWLKRAAASPVTANRRWDALKTTP